MRRYSGVDMVSRAAAMLAQRWLSTEVGVGGGGGGGGGGGTVVVVVVVAVLARQWRSVEVSGDRWRLKLMAAAHIGGDSGWWRLRWWSVAVAVL